MENIGAGLAALGVLGPGIGIGILAGMSSSAIGRAPMERMSRMIPPIPVAAPL